MNEEEKKDFIEKENSEFGIQNETVEAVIGELVVDEGALRDEGAISTGEKAVPLIDPSYKWLPLSLLAALLGAIFGVIPAVLCAHLLGIAFYPLFVAAPLLAYLFNRLLRGCNDLRMLIITAVFSLLCAYVTAITCQVAIFTSNHSMSILEIPRLTFSLFDELGIFFASFSSYIYPIIFTSLGVAVIWQLMRAERYKKC